MSQVQRPFTLVFRRYVSGTYYDDKSRLTDNLRSGIAEAFPFPPTEHNARGDVHILSVWVKNYFQHFQPLWPLFWTQDLDAEKLHPLLYLVLSSIGAMYDGQEAAAYGAVMHVELRNALLLLSPHHDQSEQETLDLGRALLLTQVAALYFEHENAFTIARRLAGSLITHAQRIGLFHELRRDSGQDPLAILTSGDSCAMEKWFDQWVLDESRKRLAFGILRAEAFMCALLSIRPLLSYEEIQIELPAAYSLWLPVERRTPQQQLYAVCQDQERSSCKGMLFSDLVSIALERDEAHPPLLAHERELLLFGLQYSVWRFSLNTEVVLRLCKVDQYDSASLDLMDRGARTMKDLRRDKERVSSALRRWQAVVPVSSVKQNGPLDRTIRMSGELLYHLSMMRMNTPTNMLHQAAYQATNAGNVKEHMREKILTWSNTSSCEASLRHALMLRDLIRLETQRDAKVRCCFNILALIGLFQAAVVVWVCRGHEHVAANAFCSKIGGSQPIGSGTASNDAETKNSVEKELMAFVDLLSEIASAWDIQSSYIRVLSRLATRSL